MRLFATIIVIMIFNSSAVSNDSEDFALTEAMCREWNKFEPTITEDEINSYNAAATAEANERAKRSFRALNENFRKMMQESLEECLVQLEEEFEELPPETAYAYDAQGITKTIELAAKYAPLTNKQPDEVHRRAAYQWGYEVGNLQLIGHARVLGEVGQGIWFGGEDWLARKLPGGMEKGKYQPFSQNGFHDSQSDVLLSLRGARDRIDGNPIPKEYKKRLRSE